MAKAGKGNKVDGWVNLNKPVGMTSTQALSIVKRALKPQKAGHAGTLDPLASGVLPIALGEATKTVPYVQDAMKTYRFTVTWGEQRSTDDSEGEVIRRSPHLPDQGDIERLIPDFLGDVYQIPPQFSAIKIDGARAYDLAREGQTVTIAPRLVYIESLTIDRHDGQSTRFSCLCGKGTYVRAIARDLGEKLGCYGYISALERTSVGPFSLDGAISLDFFANFDDNAGTEQVLLPLQTALDDIPVLALREQEAARLKNGNSLSFLSKPDLDRMTKAGIDWQGKHTALALACFDHKAIALVEVAGPELHPIRIFNI